ncbi:MAG: Mor transcription activator family protein [Rhodoferax sp.]|uniref:Mor transcription activator family protein n=1 Tax=Rhodoferax sp. TaxID=50421 RepID=UPI003BB758E8
MGEIGVIQAKIGGWIFEVTDSGKPLAREQIAIVQLGAEKDKALYSLPGVKLFNHWRMDKNTFMPVNLSRATDEQLKKVNDAFGDSAPEVWRDIAELNFVALRFCSLFDALTDDELVVMSVNLVLQLVSSFGGIAVYIPNGIKYFKAPMNASIAKEFKGNNIRQLAMKHKISDMRVRQILQEQADLKKRQSNQHHE